MASLKRKWHSIRRIFRHKWCYFTLFVASFLSFIITVSFYWEHLHEGEHRHDKVGINDDGLRMKHVREVRRSGDGPHADRKQFDDHDHGPDHDQYTNMEAISVLKKGVLGNYENRPKQPAAQSGPGEGGKPVRAEGKEAREANSEFGFNTFASDKISLNRSIPDTRPRECKYWQYPEKLPTASVVIVFHNEGWSPLLRTVHSVLLRSPPELLKEVLMVDDFSVKEHLKDRLDQYIEQFQGKVRLIRNKEREGLIRSRSIGGQNARGEVVIFLDAHCEANANWLPPLLAPIARDRRVMTVPVIDGIDMNTWAYHPQYGYKGGAALFRGIFEWGLLYKESEIPDKERKRRKHDTEPFQSPTHAGGLYAIDREWFGKLGYYDPGLQIWGGEQYELSFKIWMCGGGILFVPCSRVGHVYRNRMPYGFGKLSGPIVSINHKRVATVWMDEYLKYYLIREPFMVKHEIGDISAQLAIRKENKCKSFQWYMDNVAYDIPALYPVQPDNKVWGEAKSMATSKCLDTMGQPIPGTLGASGCHGYGGNQMFRLNVAGQMVSGEWCVLASGNRLQTNRCDKGTVSGFWDYDKETQQITHKGTRCVTVSATDSILVLDTCRKDDPNQKFVWTEIHL